MSFVLKSPALRDNSEIAHPFTKEGSNSSPPLEWKDIPSNTKELALVCEDPDAKGEEPWVHWLVYKIPPQVSSLPPNEPKAAEIQLGEDVIYQGKNSWGQLGMMDHSPRRALVNIITISFYSL